MTKRSALDGTVYEGVPPVLAVPTGLQTPEGKPFLDTVYVLCADAE